MLYVIILSPVFRIHEYGGISGTGQIENTLLNNYYLGQNYLNPFNPATKIKDTLPKEGIVKITIYNSLGQKVTELVNEFKQTGAYIAEFNASFAEQGVNLSSGIYFYQLESNGIVLTGRMLLIK